MSNATKWIAAVAIGMVCTTSGAADKEIIDAAVARGVRGLRTFQRRDGSWLYQNPGYSVGATSLAAIALLECDVPQTDPAIVAAVDYVRKEIPNLSHTYSIALALIFLDHLAEPADVPLMESLAARLVAGQNTDGGWTYNCPVPIPEEQLRLVALISQRAQLSTRPTETKPNTRREKSDFQNKLLLLVRPNNLGLGIASRSDNSNTQFATIGLWVSRRHGFPVDETLRNVDARFRLTQSPVDGGWSYSSITGFNDSRATMTCAGLMALAVGHGVKIDKSKDGKGGGIDLNKDKALQAGLLAVAQTIGTPLEQGVFAGQRPGLRNPGPPNANVGFGPNLGPAVGGKSFYFLWSLERAAMILNLETIGKKDWYRWGTDILLATQQADGTWRGEYGESGADTAFGLLFLRRANFARDLSAKLKGSLNDPGKAVLKAGGVGGDSLGGPKQGKIKSGIEDTATTSSDSGSPKSGTGVVEPPKAPKFGNSPGDKLAEGLLALPADRQGPEIDRLRDKKGVEYTEALATAIPHLSGELHGKARQALADRLTRLKVDTVAQYLKDPDAEIRRAAALAVAMKDSKKNTPDLIELLLDPSPSVARAAHAALKELTGQDFGPSADADESARKKAIASWRAWWKKNKSG